ncbi:MAG: TolB family protein [Chloroflexota bacterium]
MKQPHRIILLIIVIFWTGCVPRPAPISVIPNSTLKPTFTPTPKSPATQTAFLVPTASMTPSPVLSPAPILQDCVTISSNASQSEGTLVLENFWWGGAVTAEYTVTSFLLDMVTQKMTTVDMPGRLIQTIGVSPDRRYLLYEYDDGSFDVNYLAVVDSKGRMVTRFPNRIPPEIWWSYYSWQAKDTLRVVILDIDKEQVLPRLYKIDTQEYLPLKTDWQGAYAGRGPEWGLDWRAMDIHYFKGANIVYDPTLTRVVYPKQGELVSLTDVASGQELASTQLPKWGRLPRWSDDGEHLALIASADPKTAAGKDEFFIVRRDGPVFQRLTYLTEQFDTVHISDYAWSPDGKRIAFWLNTTAADPAFEGTQSELAIVEIDTGAIKRLCIEGISAPMRHEIQITHIQPVWSVDGQQIAFAQLDSSRANTYNVLVVDLETRTAYKVAANKEPIGWMMKEP